MQWLGLADGVRDPLAALGMLLAAGALGLVAHVVLFWLAGRLARRTGARFDEMLLRRLRGPMRLLVPLAAALVVLPTVGLSADQTIVVRRVLALALIAVGAWLVQTTIDGLAQLAARQHDIEARDNLTARQIHTQIQVLRRVTTAGITVVALSLMLMTFPSIRHIGVSLFASAGLLGVVAGVAARPAVADLLASIQIAFTQPIRLDDVVVVEGVWGRVEEINTTYVVVRSWDERRLVLPVTYFIEQPFENWTRRKAEILGAVYLYVDYTTPVDAVRDELVRVLAETDLWDGRVGRLQVTDSTEHTMELRAVVSAADSSTLWDLRCHVRERLVAYLQAEHPHRLPRTREELSWDPDRTPLPEGLTSG